MEAWQKLKLHSWWTHNRAKEGKTDSVQWMLHSLYIVLGVCGTVCMLYSGYAVLGVCCTRCMLYSVYAVLGVCCTRCMLYSVYAVLGVCCTWCKLCLGYVVLCVNSWSWNGESETNDLIMCSVMMVELGRRNRDGKSIYKQYGGNEWIWKISDNSCLIGIRRPPIRVITYWIRAHTCRLRNCQFTHTWIWLKFSLLMMTSNLLTSLWFSSSTLPSPLDTKLCNPSLSLHGTIMS